MLAVDYLSDNLKKEQILPLLSVLATLLLIGAVGYGMSYLVYV
jgi:DnaJ family protein C protein 16